MSRIATIKSKNEPNPISGQPPGSSLSKQPVTTTLGTSMIRE